MRRLRPRPHYPQKGSPILTEYKKYGPLIPSEFLEDRKFLVTVRIGKLDRPNLSLVTSPTATLRLQSMNTSKFDRVLGYGFKNTLDKIADSTVRVHLYL